MSSSQFGAPALERGVAILELLAETPAGLRTEEIAVALGLPRSSAFGLVRVLAGLGWIERDGDGRNQLGLRIFTLGAHAAHRLDVQRAAAPHLRELRDRLGLTVHLAVLASDGGVVYVDKVDGPGFVRFDTYVGKRSDAHLTAVGKALLAELEPAAVEAEIARRGLRRGTERSVATIGALHEQLAAVRANGFALEDQEEVEGVRCVAAAVRRYEQPALAAIGCIGLTSDLSDAAIASVAVEVRRCAESISGQLGGGGR